MNLQFKYRSAWADFLMYFTIFSILILTLVITGTTEDIDRNASSLAWDVIILCIAYPVVMVCLSTYQSRKYGILTSDF